MKPVWNPPSSSLIKCRLLTVLVLPPRSEDVCHPGDGRGLTDGLHLDRAIGPARGGALPEQGAAGRWAGSRRNEAEGKLIWAAGLRASSPTYLQSSRRSSVMS